MPERIEGEVVRRPDPPHWVWYALGGRLPQRYKGWVLSDATRRHWMLRHEANARRAGRRRF